MKKLVLIGCLTCLAGMACGQFSVRPQVGINFPSLTEDITQGKWKGNVGYQFGADVQIGGNLYFQPGLNFQSTSLTVRDVGDMEVSRINLPVLVGLQLFDGLGSAIGIPVGTAPIHVANAIEAPLPEDPDHRIRAFRYWDPATLSATFTTRFELDLLRRQLSSCEELGASRTAFY
ncbi:MAG: hypothetical protein R3330_04285, partial [Saprospiraceae bacterium]|nr:hypothetical protein [Saprospiraceae bacterium]